MSNIVSLKQIGRFVKPNTATLVGGAFDLFHIGHLRFLKVASEIGRPLIVVVQTDKMVSIRKGLRRPIINQKHRAEIIAALEFVDFVLILDKPTHCEEYLKIINPKNLIFFKENLTYRKMRAEEIKKTFPRINSVFIGSEDVGKKVMSTTRIANKILEKPNLDKIKNPIARELHSLSEKSKAKVGKISALLMYKSEIIQGTGNDRREHHAEILAIKSAKKRNIPIQDCDLYVLIPPCTTCSEFILKSGIKNVHYLYPYVDSKGLKLLRRGGVKVNKFKG